MATDLEQDVTLGELGRRMDGLAGTVKDGFGELKAEVAKRPTQADVELVRTGLQGQLDALAARLAKSEAWGTWGGRLVGAAVALAALSVVVKAPG